MDLTDLSPAQLERLTSRARDELERRQRRKPAGVVRQVLELSALEAGYTLAEVFPEFPHLLRAEPAPAPETTAREAAPAPVAVSDTSPAPSTRPASSVAPQPPVDVPGRVVVLAAASASTYAGLALGLERVREAAGLQDDWPRFHAAMEDAVRRGWMYFQGNDACVLTQAGLDVAQAGR